VGVVFVCAHPRKTIETLCGRLVNNQAKLI